MAETSVTWKVCRGDVVLAYGPEATMPRKELRKKLREDGYEIYLDGKRVRI